MNKNLRKISLKAFKYGVLAADPTGCLERAIKKNPIPVPNGGKYIVISLGKAACLLMKTMIDILPTHAEKKLLAITNYENVQLINECEVLGASHPVPDKNGIKASQKVISILQNASLEDTLVILISGGSSALLPAPVNGLILQDKIEINQLLLNSDLSISEINLIRQTMSVLKGGGFTTIANPVPIYSFILSDVIGDDLKVIGSGPTVSPIGNIQQSYKLLIKKNLYSKLSFKLQNYFRSENQKLFKPNILSKNILIGNNKQSVEAMAKMANAEVISYPIIGNVQTATEIIFKEISARHEKKYVALAFGGETTVEVLGNGVGGRNQELALRVADKLHSEKLRGRWCFLSGGTDGQDGPTKAAGGIVDQDTILRLNYNNICIKNYLDNNDSNHALKVAEDLLITGSTGTNVADLQLFLWEKT